MERETKFDVPDGFEVPDPDAFAERIERATVHLVSTYYDTAELSLLGHRVTLRRREGDADTGWHLKIPTGAARTELHLPLTEDGAEVPARLAGLVRGIALGAPLRPVARIETERRLHRLLTGSRLLAEIADDRVHATTSDERALDWREVEVELGDPASGDETGPDRAPRGERLLAALGSRLVAAGAAPAASPSKLARVLQRPGVDDPDPAAALIARYLREQLAVLGAGDVALRRGLDPIHRTRVAARRFRSALRVLGTAVDAERAGQLDAELAWYQDLLGEVRDRQVQRARFAAAVGELPEAAVLGPVADDIDAALLAEQAAARKRLDEALDGERYRALLAECTTWAQRPPVRAGTDTALVLHLADRARHKAAKRLRRAVRTQDPVALHRARKAVKRARYATELTVPSAGAHAQRVVKRHKKAQDVLGEHQDSVVAAELLRRLGAAAARRPDRNGFTYGVLWQREQHAARRARRRAAELRL